MDGNEFDLISRKLGALATRRRTLGGLAAGLLGAAGVAGVAEAKTKGKKKGVGKQQACGGNGCQSGGACVSGYDATACGHGGNVQCDDCTNFNPAAACIPTTNGGFCAAPIQCEGGSARNCITGVSGSQQCVLRGSTTSCGQNDNASGNTGEPICNPPCASGQVCPTQGRQATCGTTTCASFCANGCCDGEGTCHSGNETHFCGNNGGFCIACDEQSSTATCNALAGGGGVCSNAACSPQNCPGCCTSAGACANGNAQGACGSGGAACKACATGEVCNGTNCVAPPPTCTPANCTGCCQGTTCVTTPSDEACGLGGVTCVTCTGKKHCKNGSTCKKKKHH